MGVSCTASSIEYPNFAKGKTQHNCLKELSTNALYRSKSVYKECCYPGLPTKCKTKVTKSFAPTKQPKEPVTRKINSDNFFWSKVYKSPTVNREVEYRNDIVKDDSLLPTDLSFLFPVQLENDNVSNVAPSRAVGTSVSSFIRPSVNKRSKLWSRFTTPWVLCPCCTGGDDAVEEHNNYCYGTTANSYESIELKTDSNDILRSLDLDPSIMSIIRLHRNLQAKKTPRIYAKIVKVMLHNTYKNAVTILEVLKAI